MVCVPKTIDNDVSGTQRTFGFDTAVSTATEAIDRLHSTAESHERVMVVELMGRYAGWIALYSGLSGSADVILMPEIPFDIEKVCEKIRAREAAGRHFSIVVVAEGARPSDGAIELVERRGVGTVDRLGGIGSKVARAIEPHRQGDADAGARPPAARRLAHHVRPAARAPFRRRGGARDRGRGFGIWSGSTGRTSPACRWPTWSADQERSARRRHRRDGARARDQPRATERARRRSPTEDPRCAPILPRRSRRHRHPARRAHRRSLSLAGRRRDPKTRAWTDAQNALTETYLAAVPGRETIRRRLEELLAIGVLSTPTPARGRYFYQRRDGRQNQPVLYVRDGVDGDRPGGGRSERARRRRHDRARLVLSERGRRLLAYGLSEDGSEQSVLHLLDVATGEHLADRIPRTRAAALAWLPDGSGFYYTRYPAPGEVPEGEEHYHRAIYFHRLGTDPAADPLVFRPAQKEYWPGVGLSPDGRWLVIGVARTFDQTDLYLQDSPRGGGLVAVAKDLPAIVRGRDGARPALPAHQSRRADLPAVRGGSRAAGADGWRELMPPRADAVLEGVRVTAAHLALSYLERASSRLRLADLDGRQCARWRCRRSAASSASAPSRTAASCSTASRRTPCRRASTGSTSRPEAESLWRRVEADVDPARFEVRQVAIRSKDGTAISMFLVHRSGLRARRQQSGLSHRLRRLQHQHDAGVLPLAAALAGAWRRRGHAQHPGRRRVRRGLAPGRDARQQAEQLRRLHRRRRVADRARATPGRRGWRWPAARTAGCSWARC